MVYRMAEYKAILQRKYELPVKQFVIYLGNEEPKMRNTLLPEEQITGFELRNIHQLPVDQILESDIPEEIVLSILTDYPTVDAEEIIGRIIRKLKSVSSNEAALKKHLQQLITLSRIRKLEKETEKQIEAMPITYNIETDYLYNKAKEDTRRAIVVNMLRDPSMTVDKIAEFTGTSISFVRKVKSETTQV